MPLVLKAHSRSQAIFAMAEALGVHGSQQLTMVGIVAAQLRAACEANSAFEQRGMHTARLVDAVLRNVSGVMDESIDARSFVHQVLEAQGDLGELWRTQGGFWHATPARMISLPSGDAFLLGGTSASPTMFIAEGVVRYAASASPRTAAIQNIDDWLGHEDPIDVWTSKALRHYGNRLSYADLPPDHLQIYAPDQAGRHFRSSWMDASDFTLRANELRLCRAITADTEIYDRPYYLGELGREGTNVRLLRSASVPHNHARRFRFGFDDKLSAHRMLRIQQREAVVHLAIANDLPQEERRILALGWPTASTSSRTVLNLLFPTRAIPFVAHALRRLGVKIEGGVK